MPDSETITRAAQEGWLISLLFATIVILGFVGIGWLLRQIWNRYVAQGDELTRLNQRMGEMEAFQRGTLVSLVEKSNETMRQLKDELGDLKNAVRSAPCGEVLEQYRRERDRGN